MEVQQPEAGPENPAAAAEPRRRETSMKIEPHRYIVWSTNALDLADPFQRRHYMRQVLIQGRTNDIRSLNLHEVALILDELRLPPAIHALWKRFFRDQGYAPG